MAHWVDWASAPGPWLAAACSCLQPPCSAAGVVLQGYPKAKGLAYGTTLLLEFSQAAWLVDWPAVVRYLCWSKTVSLRRRRLQPHPIREGLRAPRELRAFPFRTYRRKADRTSGSRVHHF